MPIDENRFARLPLVDFVGRKNNSPALKTSRDFQKASFDSSLKCSDKIAFTLENQIKIWDTVSNKCVHTLELNSRVICLVRIDENRFASGSGDKTIIIWDSKEHFRIKTIKDLKKSVASLKSLPSNRLACASFDDIKIWDIESGVCLNTVNLEYTTCFVCLPNENLVSGGRGKIVISGIDRGECIKKISVMESVESIVVLKNGQLACGQVASGTNQRNIKIWNVENGVCVKILKGHSNAIRRLHVLESGELVSCSEDKTIKLWNVETGDCILTLLGHNNSVLSIIINKQNNTLISSSKDGTIKTWDLKTGGCVNTIPVLTDAWLLDLIFI